MKLQSLAQIAEILGGIAVLVSLVFLIMEIQENTAVSKAATYQQLTGQALELMLEGSRNPELSSAIRKFSVEGIESLGEEDAFRYFLWSRAGWRHFENAYFQHQHGVLGDNEWRTYLLQTCANYRLEGAEFWETAHKDNLDPGFAAKVKESCD